MPGPCTTGDTAPIMQVGHPPRTGRWFLVAGLVFSVALAGCSYWTHPTKPATAFSADASVCQTESFQASTTIDASDVTRRNAYLACLRAKGWSLRERP